MLGASEVEAIADLLRDMLSVEIGDDAGDMPSLEVKPEKESANTLGSLIFHPPISGQSLPLAKHTQKLTLREPESPSCDTGKNWGPARPESRRKSIFTMGLVEIPLREWLRRPGQILVTHVSWAEKPRAETSWAS